MRTNGKQSCQQQATRSNNERCSAYNSTTTTHLCAELLFVFLPFLMVLPDQHKTGWAEGGGGASRRESKSCPESNVCTRCGNRKQKRTTIANGTIKGNKAIRECCPGHDACNWRIPRYDLRQPTCTCLCLRKLLQAVGTAGVLASEDDLIFCHVIKVESSTSRSSMAWSCSHVKKTHQCETPKRQPGGVS